MQMDVGLDTGDMLLKEALPIADSDTTSTLHDKVATLGARMVVQALADAAQGVLQPVVQPVEGVTYAHKIDKDEAPIRWADDAAAIVRRIRAFNPFPGASTVLDGEVIKVWAAQAQATETAAPFGQIVAVAPGGIAVAAMNSVVLLTELQRPGGKRLPVADFLRGMPLQVGQRFDLPPL
jgi:methionyl-tRNA formyltransferase